MVRRKVLVSAAVLATLGMAELTVSGVAQAGMFDMMNPSKWFGSSRDRDYYYDRDYYGGRGWGGPYGWGGGPYGWGGWGGPYGWGGGPYGWGGWGYPGVYGYPYGGVPATGTTQQAPAPKVPE